MVNDQYRISKVNKKYYLWKKNSCWYGCRDYFSMDERTSKFNIMLSEELKKFSNEVNSKIYFDYDLKKVIGLILVVKLKFTLNLIIYLI